MSELRLCRICLSSDVKLYEYDLYHLKQYYEEIMAVKVNKQDQLPHQFCYECAAMLYKFHKFKEKCWMGQQILTNIICKGPMTLKSISKIDKKEKNLISLLNIVTVNSKVRTCSVKSKTLKAPLLHKIDDTKGSIEKNIDLDLKLPEIDNIKVDSDDSLDINLADYKNEILEKQKQIIEVMINNEVEKIDIELEKIDTQLEKTEMDIDKTDVIEKVYDNETVPDIYDDRIASDDEKSNCEMETCINDEKSVEKVIENKVVDKRKRESKKNNQSKVQSKKVKRMKFEVGPEKGYLDPKHWLKVNLNEDEALEEFKARAHNRKYLAAAFKCSDCFKGFSKEDMLTRHVKLRHAESVGTIVCRFCSMRFRRKCFLTKHITQHFTRYKCLRCDLVCDLKNTALFHNDYHNGVIRKCMHCGHEFKHLSTYYTHLRSHRSEHVCTRCGASFVSAVGLAIHTRNMHLDAAPNPEEEVSTYCQQCDVQFVTRAAYEQHVFHSAKHGDAPPGHGDTTTAAPYKLNSRLSLKGFRRNPRKQTPCNICNRNFSSYTAYMKHHNDAHKDVPTAGREERHICEICGASLAAGSVFAHLNTHTRDKLFACDTCGMSFGTKSSMTRHQLVHTGEKPYSCSLCEKRFTQHSSVKLHYRTVHLKQPYPKRNRRKKIPPEESMLGEAYRNSEDSEENLKPDRWLVRR